MEKNEQKRWHSLETGEILRDLSSDENKGLNEEALRENLRKYGPNTLPVEKGPGRIRRFLAQFNNILIYILIISGCIALVLQHWVDSAVIFAVVVINAIVGYIQEGKAQKALESIRNLLSLEAQVIRAGRKKTIRADDLTVGDLVLVESGDKIPADLRLLETKNLKVQEAALTGESEAVEKDSHPVADDAPLGDRYSMAYSGTLVTQGRGKGVVVAVGTETEIGRISEMVSGVEELQTPLIRQINRFAWFLTILILAVSISVFFFGLFFREYSLNELFLATVGIAVAAIPEGLPPILTIALAIGVRRMAHRQAIIRKLPAVETLGSVTCICTDKTGTLTKNEMTVQAIVTADKVVDVTGTGYEPRGELRYDGGTLRTESDPLIGEVLLAGVLCNDAELNNDPEQGWKIAGDPTEGSLLVLADKAGLDRKQVAGSNPRLDSIPFESQHKYMATLHKIGDETVTYVKGAPDRVFEMCKFEQNGEGRVPLRTDYWNAKLDEIAGRGHRLLAIAKKTETNEGGIDHEHVQSGLTLLGLVGIMDPPREEATRAVKTCHEAGIRVKMITGDYAQTAEAIGGEVGIGSDRAVTGKEVEDQTDEQLEETVEKCDIFARTSPGHKLRLVKALQKRNHVVAMTGDGVNDAPALKRADVGVSMGIKGSEAAKEASEMVLANDNFVSIEHAVEEGRTVYANLRKTILFLLPTNGGQAIIVISAILFGMVLPITPVQILWVNMVSAVTLALALAFEPPEQNIMKVAPRDPREPMITGYFAFRIFYVSVLLVIASLGAFLFVRTQFEVEVARTTAVNALVVGSIFYLLNSRFISEPSLSIRGLFGNKYVWLSIGILTVLQILFTYLPALNLMFGSAPLPPIGYAWVFGAGLTIFLIVEIEKFFRRKFFEKPGEESK